MPQFNVYYLKHMSNDSERRKLLRSIRCIGYDAIEQGGDKVNFVDLHTFLTQVEAQSVEHVFHQMQAEVWSPNGEQRELIESKGLFHTSMSVGDMVEEVSSGRLFMCDPIGFTEIELKMSLPSLQQALGRIKR